MQLASDAPDTRTIGAPDGLRAVVAAAGAELVGLQAPDGAQLLWDAGPAWTRHAPVLFPIVGRLAGDTLRDRGRAYRLTQHGFARDRSFAWLSHDAGSCALRLTDDARSREVYPFGFVFDVAYTVSGLSLSVTMRVANPGDAMLPASLGAHPAFRWPLVPGVDKQAHRLVFAEAESGPVRRLQDGLMMPEPQPNPVVGRVLALDAALFDADAMILPATASHALRYEAGEGGPALDFSWQGADTLGLWSKRGGDFLCIEPWRGHASPIGFDGAFADKPGVVAIAPGEVLELAWHVRYEAGRSA